MQSALQIVNANKHWFNKTEFESKGMWYDFFSFSNKRIFMNDKVQLCLFYHHLTERMAIIYINIVGKHFEIAPFIFLKVPSSLSGFRKKEFEGMNGVS